jgi:hypothetical protein
VNPSWGTFDYPGRNASALRPNLEATWDREARATWQAAQALARVPGVRPPADDAQLLAWAQGRATTGARYEGIVLAELRQRWEERRRPVAPKPPPMLGEVGPWRQDGIGRWGRHAIKRGRTHVGALVYVRRDYRDWSAWWSAWRIGGLGDPPRGMTAPGEREIKAAVDAWLVGRRVRLG